MFQIPRHAANTLKKRYKQARSLYIYGPRQSGKTTLARSTFPKWPYSSLENPDEQEFAEEDAVGYLKQFPKGAILDEVQRTPKLLSYLQSEIDIHQKKFILTSSQNFLLSANSFCLSFSIRSRTSNAVCNRNFFIMA